MKFFALSVLLVVCLVGVNGSFLSNLGHDISKTADSVEHDAEGDTKTVVNHVSTGLQNAGKDIQANAPAIDKAANEIEPVAKVIASGIAIGNELDVKEN